MENKNENADSKISDNLNELLDIQIDELDETALREKLTEIIPKYKETHQSNKQLFERAKSAEGGLRELKERIKTLEEKPKDPVTVGPEAKTGELEEAQLDFFELKGFSDPDQVAVFQEIMKKTGMSHRDVVKDDYALTRVKSIQQEKEVRGATPGSTKHGGEQVDDFGSAIAKFEQTGELPADFDLRSKVVNALEQKTSAGRPTWRR